MRKSQAGSATVELALALPILTIFLLLIVQVGVVMLDQLAVTQAAREGARAAAVDPKNGVGAAAARRATGLPSERLAVVVSKPSGSPKMVTVRTSFTSRVVFPFTQRVLLEPKVEGRASMLVEAEIDPSTPFTASK